MRTTPTAISNSVCIEFFYVHLRIMHWAARGGLVKGSALPPPPLCCTTAAAVAVRAYSLHYILSLSLSLFTDMAVATPGYGDKYYGTNTYMAGTFFLLHSRRRALSRALPKETENGRNKLASIFRRFWVDSLLAPVLVSVALESLRGKGDTLEFDDPYEGFATFRICKKM